MDFITGVNRLLRHEHVIQGDDDEITAFTDSHHAADISLAQLAIQHEILALTADKLISYEHTTGTISLVSGQRSYTLAADFIRFFGVGSFYDSTDNVRFYEYKGGESALMNHDYQYKVTTGAPAFWYWDHTTTKKVAFYNIPSAVYDTRSLAYDYEKSVLVTNTTDTLPFHNNEEAYAFVECASRRFHYLRTNKETGLLSQDPTYNFARSTLSLLMKPTNPVEGYGKEYG